jgi:hypothetical protein
MDGTWAPIISTFVGRKKRIATSFLLPSLQDCLLILHSYAPSQVTAFFTRYLKKLHAAVTNSSILKMEAVRSSEKFVRTNIAMGFVTQKTTTQFCYEGYCVALIEVAIFLEELYIF